MLDGPRQWRVSGISVSECLWTLNEINVVTCLFFLDGDHTAGLILHPYRGNGSLNEKLVVVCIFLLDGDHAAGLIPHPYRGAGLHTSLKVFEKA
jgi:hypothetical protein